VNTHQKATGRGRVSALLVALVVSLAGLVTFTSLVAGAGEWVEGREVSVVLPWALPALVASAAATAASIAALRTTRATVAAVLGAAVVVAALVALVLVNPAIGHPVP
jgi:hypothetical protein